MTQPLRENERYTYADYCTWDDSERWELIDGVPYSMSPAPATVHQRISIAIVGQLYGFLRGKTCEVFHAPFDVRLNAAGDDDDTVVQPDIVVVCDSSKLDGKGCNGAPDIVIEILSPATARLDKMLKFNKYLRAGVREYWIVDPDTKTVSTYILKNGEYMARAYGDADTVPVYVLEGCRIDLQGVFAGVPAQE